jgi:hypothetical protein
LKHNSENGLIRLDQLLTDLTNLIIGGLASKTFFVFKLNDQFVAGAGRIHNADSISNHA